ncbi:hypothetical protein [Paraburkholderia elongata]|uniref:Uncharacterized protein n=1 Tax=Paraburkholderia elongata TaxID=2675747 RepID=A0A972NYV2_9BURK|nr:hypothetical protein [Paraburkholderia elongata]NPT62361.1 hypothetical protein [Paraburkholderia elongata]
MLNPREFATLMLVKDAAEHAELDRADLETLLERQLVKLEKLASGHQHPCITESGYFLLNAVTQLH